MPYDAQVSDRALVDRVLAGDPRAADQFVARFTRLVWWILIHQIRLAHEPAEEVYQDVFVHLWEDEYRRLRNWSGDGDFAAYLAPIVRHRALDRLRREPGERALPIQEGTDFKSVPVPVKSVPVPADDRPGAEELALVEEQRRLLGGAVGALGEQDRRLYGLRFAEERSYKEISVSLGITVTNVGVRLNRLVERLRASVTEDAVPKTRKTGPAVRLPGPGPSPK
jgi:RNA polymerase sigma-70 factor (ECF subfamily)